MIRDDLGSPSPFTRRPALSRFGQSLLGVSLLLFAAGCPGSAPTAPAAGGIAGGGAPAAGGAQVDEQCLHIVSSIHDMFQLSKLGQTTSVGDGVLQLNDWGQTCGPKDIAPPKLSARLRDLLGEERSAALQSPRFTLRDGEHLRDGVLFRAMARHAFKTENPQAPELLKVTTAFQYVVRVIELVDRHPQDLPLTPYEIVLLGKGTPADRAWIFASLLTQQKFDSVLIAPKTKEGDGSNPAGPFLVGVILEGQTYLFDPRAGVAIPAPGAAENPARITGVATLDEAATNPEVLKQLDVDEDHPYPLRSSDLAQPNVLLISNLAFWTDRMRALQGQFSGDNSMVLSDPLQDTESGVGLWTRVGKGGGKRWSEETLEIWGYPESQLGPHATMSDDQKTVLSQTFLPFEAYSTPVPNPADGKLMLIDQEQVDDPAAGKFDPGKAKRVRTTKGAQMRARLADVGGYFANAVQDYHTVWKRSRELAFRAMQKEFPIEQQTFYLHLRAIDDASFFTAHCKFEQKSYRVATSALQRYREQQPKGAWLRQCRYLMALSLAAQEDYQGAVDELEAVAADDPEYAGYQWLIRQWQHAEPEETAPADNKPDETENGEKENAGKNDAEKENSQQKSDAEKPAESEAKSGS
jgi:hypothetical protein